MGRYSVIEMVAAFKEQIRRQEITLPGSTFPPVSLDALMRAEAELGFPLPPLLRTLYLEVANGGFGPGVLGIKDGYTEEGDETIEMDYAAYQELLLETHSDWPARMINIHDQGCAVWTAIDCSKPEAPVYTREATDGEKWNDWYSLSSPSLHEWLEHYLDSVGQYKV